MDLVLILKAYIIFSIIVIFLYTIRHLIFTYNRLYGRQKIYYNDLIDSDFPDISVLIPMFNEENVASDILDNLLKCKYNRAKIEIIPIDDFSTDNTKEILEKYEKKYSIIKPLYRTSKKDRGKPKALNEAMEKASGEIIIVFDADYKPTKKMLQRLAIAFKNPSIGAVMGRVIPDNSNTNLLTKLIDLERTGGYQVDQQARYNLKLMPQYGGTVGGYRKNLIIDSGGFNPKILAEDTEITFRLYTQGYKVIYANDAECYEQSPETWKSRGIQVSRWSRGHNNIMFRYFLKVIFSKYMSFLEKLDGIFLLCIYSVPLIISLAITSSILLLYFGEMSIFTGWWQLIFIGIYSGFGNFAPFYEIANGLIIDGRTKELFLLPLLIINFFFYIFYISIGFFKSIKDLIFSKNIRWHKTQRFKH
ncbi:MAG: glycosyltransferase [Bacillota bacterium]